MDLTRIEELKREATAFQETLQKLREEIGKLHEEENKPLKLMKDINDAIQSDKESIGTLDLSLERNKTTLSLIKEGDTKIKILNQNEGVKQLKEFIEGKLAEKEAREVIVQGKIQEKKNGIQTKKDELFSAYFKKVNDYIAFLQVNRLDSYLPMRELKAKRDFIHEKYNDISTFLLYRDAYGTKNKKILDDTVSNYNEIERSQRGLLLFQVICKPLPQ